MKIGRLLQAMLALPPRWRLRRCVLCEHRVGRFLPYPGGRSATPRLMIVLDVVGSDVDNFECPFCGCHDRERHLLLYLRATGLLEHFRDKSILHFAPERRLSPLITARAPSRYVKCDLYPASNDVFKVDILRIPFQDNTFDVVIANHVLEHVDDDRLALSELRRVLRPNGSAILQTPYSLKLQCTWSDPGIDSEAARLQAFGQSDHVRLYGADIFERFSAVGLRADIGTHAQLLPDYDPHEVGVNGREPFFLFRRED